MKRYIYLITLMLICGNGLSQTSPLDSAYYHLAEKNFVKSNCFFKQSFQSNRLKVYENIANAAIMAKLAGDKKFAKKLNKILEQKTTNYNKQLNKEFNQMFAKDQQIRQNKDNYTNGKVDSVDSIHLIRYNEIVAQNGITTIELIGPIEIGRTNPKYAFEILLGHWYALESPRQKTFKLLNKLLKEKILPPLTYIYIIELQGTNNYASKIIFDFGNNKMYEIIRNKKRKKEINTNRKSVGALSYEVQKKLSLLRICENTSEYAKQFVWSYYATKNIFNLPKDQLEKMIGTGRFKEVECE